MSGTKALAAMAKTLAKYNMSADEDASKLLAKVDGTQLALAILRLESTKVLTLEVLRSLGQGSGSGVMLVDCTSAKERTEARQEIAAALIKKRPGLLGSFNDEGADLTSPEAQKTAALAVQRIVDKIGNEFRVAFTGMGTNENGKGEPTVILTSTEEDRAYSDHTFGSKEREENTKKLVIFYNLKVRDHQLGSSKVMKMVAYWILKEGCLPDSTMITLETFRRLKTDTGKTLFIRYLYTCGLVAAGILVLTQRDDGAGVVKKYGVQWFSMDVAVELLNEVSEYADALEDGRLRRVLALVLVSLHKATQRGGESASLAMARMVGQIPTLIETARAGSGNPSAEPGTKKTKAEKKAAAAAAAAAAVVPAKTTPVVVPTPRAGSKRRAPTDTGMTRFVDKAGEAGPNGLARMVGGNPSGGPCREFARSGKCGFGTCSFSH